MYHGYWFLLLHVSDSSIREEVVIWTQRQPRELGMIQSRAFFQEYAGPTVATGGSLESRHLAYSTFPIQSLAKPLTSQILQKPGVRGLLLAPLEATLLGTICFSLFSFSQTGEVGK